MDVAWERWVARRDPQALNQVVHDSAGMVYATCLRILGNPTEAEDVAQECYEALLREKDAARVRVVGAWLHGAATYRSLTRLRAEDRRARREAQYAAEQPAQVEPVRNEIHEHVDEALAELPEDLRAPLVQTFLCGRTQREVAKQLGIPRRTLRHRIDTGLEQLGQLLRQRGVVVEMAALTGLLATAAAQASQAPASLTQSLGKLALSQSAGAAAPMVVTAGVGAKGAWIAVGMLVMVSALGCAAWLYAGKPPDPPQEAAATAVAPEREPDKNVSRESIAQGLLTWLKSAPPETVAAPKAPVKVSGYVVDEDGAPVSDVQIGLKKRWEFYVGPTSAVPVNEKGEFVCTDSEKGPLQAEEYEFFYCAKRLTDEAATRIAHTIPPVEAPNIEITPVMLAEDREIQDIRVVVPSAKRVVRGMVRDEEGQPVSGAGVVMHISIPNAETVTDPDGRFTLTRVRPNRMEMSVEILKSMTDDFYYPITVCHPDYECADVDAKTGDENVEVTLYAKRRGSVKGMVVDARTDKPLLTPKVWIGRMVTNYGETKVLSYALNAPVQLGGVFHLKDLPAGSATLWASAPGYGTAFISPVRIEADTDSADVVIRLEPEGIIETRANLDRYPKGALVAFDTAIKNGASREDCFVNVGGTCGFYHVAPGRYEVAMGVNTTWDAEHYGGGTVCYSTSVEVEEGKTTTVELGTPGNGAVQGVLTPLADGQTMRFTVRKGPHDTPVSDDWGDTRFQPKGLGTQRLAVEDIFIWGMHDKQFNGNQFYVGFLSAGTFTVTALLYDEATQQVRQQSKVFTVGDCETATIDFAF
jgi:RNA polymerase sigma factor (sigma-70 family)